MDKNFVNIDDLVRQRLTGGEEQERSGAWLRMREVLDQEMPQKRGGFIYWRRTLSALSVLLLIGTITVGGYELSNALKNRDGNAMIASVTAAPAATPPADNTPVNTAALKDNEVTNSRLSATGITDNNTDGNHINSNDNTNHKLHSNATAATRHSKPVSGDAHKAGDNKEAANTVAGVDNGSAVNNDLTANTTNSKPEKIAGNKTGGLKTDNNTAAVKSLTAASNTNKVTKKETVLAANVTPKSAPATKVVVTEKVSLKESSATATAGKLAKTKTVKAAQPVKTNNNAVAGKDAGHKGRAAKTVAEKTPAKKMEAVALSSKAPAMKKKENTAATTTPVARKANPAQAGKPLSTDELALSAHLSAAKTVAPVKADNVINTKGTPAKENIGTGDKVAAVPVTTPVVAPAVVAEKVSRKEKEAVAINVKKGKKVVQKLVLLEHYVKITPTEGYFHIDTISMEEFTEDMGIAADDKNKPYLPKSAKAKGIVAGSETADNTATADAQILPGATASVTGKPALGTKESALGKKSSGASVMKNLSSAFNDIKYRASGAKFSAGLIGGINGTFFGPNSFKGFQFGVTGSFVFSSEWSINTALEYFHRINGSYSLYDNYYTYTPAANGYTKQAESYAYSFSTLHSIELPVAASYAHGNFNFFVGGNFVYNFAINTGAAPQDPVGTPQYTSVMGNDNKPILAAHDFNAKFGIGCLFGISYRVAPNVTLDLRNVQTLWDMSKTAGEKYVSSQLYKSPSLQLSLGYRFGGKKKD